jgi:hypothetical protein
MSNPIKYSTGTESLALKKGNFYIGTGDVGKGPTSSTGYYNGITPPSGGYTIYLNKETGGPSIYTVSNDTQLISLTNSIAGQSYTTANECLVYFAGQTDKMVLNRNYEGIVTDGLIFNLDAGFTPSYPKSGTTWYDVSVNTNNGTLTNGPTYSGNDGGGIVFDGTNDYIDLGSPSELNFGGKKDITICQFIKVSSFSTSNMTSLMWEDVRGGNGNEPVTMRYGWFNSAIKKVTFLLAFGNNLETILDSTTVLQTNIIYYVCGTYDGIKMKIYINGILENEVNENRSLKTPISNDAKWVIGTGEFNTSRWFDGTVYNTQIYNRALSADEVLQNFNAQKGRFGL